MSDLSKKNQQNNPRDMDIYEAFKRETSYKGSSSGLKKKLFKLQLKEKKCECCGITEWNGKPAPLQLHHKDGDNKNNELDNLEILCANCHAQTDTYTGKNIKKKIETIVNIRNNKEKIENNIPIVDEKYFLQLIYQYHNYAKMSEVLGVDIKLIKKWHKYFIDNQGFSVILSDKAPSREVLKTKIRTKSFVQIGKEYNVTDNSVRKWCDAYNLPRKVSDIKSISDEEWETI